MKEVYQLRKANFNDHDNIYMLKTESVRPYVEKIWGWDEEYQRKDFDADFCNIAQFDVIECNGCFAGFLQTYCHENYLELVEIHIIPSKRGRGIGTSIITEILKYAASSDKTVCIGCFKDNIEAKTLYLRLGFVLVTETDTHYLLSFRK